MTRLFVLFALLSTPALAEPSIQVAFSPGNSTETVVGVIASAQKTVHVAAFSFTSKPIAQALLDASRMGVSVEVVLDKSNVTARYSEVGEIARAGIPVRIDSQYPIMHDKFIVVDGVTVETGSFNYTRHAAFNAENLLVLRDMPEVATRYEAEWNRLWNESEPYAGSEAP